MKKFTLFVFILVSVFAKAQEGFPDPSYGNGGYVATIFNEPSVDNIGIQRRILLDNNGRLVGAIVVNRVVILVRYDSNGMIDNSFNGGAVIHDFNSQFSTLTLHSIGVQPDGKIVLVASNVVMRFNSNGTFDNTFGTNGFVGVPVGGRVDLRQVRVGADGTIVMTLHEGGPGASRFYTFIINPDGKSSKTVFADIPTFPGLGIGFPSPTALFVQPDGKIVQGGEASQGSILILKRLNPDGTPDATFGTNGVIARTGTRPETITVQSDGKIIIETQNRLYRFNLNGSLDSSFGNNGVVQVPFNVMALSVEDDNKIVAAGNITAPGATGHFLLARYDANGSSFDPSFGYGGMTALALSPTPQGVTDMVITNDRIYVNGFRFAAAFQTSSSTMTANPPSGVQRRAIGEKIEEQKLSATVSPNPATTHFVLRLQGTSNKPMQIRIYDAVGRTIELKRNVTAGNTLRLGDSYRPGVYYAEVVQGNEKRTLKLIKASR